MTDDDRLADLLIQWEEILVQGRDVSAAELCKDCPQLIEGLSHRLQAMRATSWMDLPVDGHSDDPPIPDVPSPDITPRTLVNRYRLDQVIAEGGFALVWRGYDLELQRIVAVKVPKPNRLVSPDSFMAEARRVARLQHPGIVPVFDVGREGESCFIVSEFVELGSLADHLSNNSPSQQQAVRWIAEIADAMEYAHLHGIVHRDIKPANILIDNHNRARLADFGIAQSANKSAQQALSLGTLRYMSPEELEGKTVDPRADIFSLGVVLHEALSGRVPYSSDEPNVLRREIVSGVRSVSGTNLPAELCRILEKALQYDPQGRYRSAALFATDLRAWLSPEGPRIGQVKVLMLNDLIIELEKAPEGPRIGQVKVLVGIILFLIAVVVVAAWLKWKMPMEKAGSQEDPASKKPEPMKLNVALALGKQNFDTKKYNEAVGFYTEAIEIDPACAEAYHRRGASLFNTGKLQEGMADLDKAVELNPKNAELRKHRSFPLSHLRQYDKAIADLEEAIRLNPLDQHNCQKLLVVNWYKMSQESQKNLRWEEAIDLLNKAIKWEPSALYLEQRGICYLNIKEYEKAVADFTMVIKLEPAVARHYEKRATAYRELGRVEEANADTKTAAGLVNNK